MALVDQSFMPRSLCAKADPEAVTSRCRVRAKAGAHISQLTLQCDPSNRSLIGSAAFKGLSCYKSKETEMEKPKHPNANSGSAGHTKGPEPECHHCWEWDQHP